MLHKAFNSGKNLIIQCGQVTKLLNITQVVSRNRRRTLNPSDYRAVHFSHSGSLPQPALVTAKFPKSKNFIKACALCTFGAITVLPKVLRI